VNKDKIPRWETMLAKMPGYMIDERGIIKEWLTPLLTNNDSHRHSSQLYPLYDGIPDEIAGSPELRAAFRKSIEFKLDNYWRNNQRGFMSFGLVQLGQAASSLGDSELAYRCLTQLINRYWLNNLASMHNHRELFNMDISGGMPAVVIKTLVASEPGELQLLPALPRAWPAGTIEGVLCRGQIEVRRLHWTPEGIECAVRSGKAQTVLLDVPAGVVSVTVEGKSARVSRTKDPSPWRLTLPAGGDVTVKIAYGP
jgi:alpha-L-fucosidase 2